MRSASRFIPSANTIYNNLTWDFLFVIFFRYLFGKRSTFWQGRTVGCRPVKRAAPTPSPTCWSVISATHHSLSELLAIVFFLCGVRQNKWVLAPLIIPHHFGIRSYYTLDERMWNRPANKTPILNNVVKAQPSLIAYREPHPSPAYNKKNPVCKMKGRHLRRRFSLQPSFMKDDSPEDKHKRDK